MLFHRERYLKRYYLFLISGTFFIFPKRLPTKHGLLSSNQSLYDKKKDKEMFFTKMIPFCKEAFLDTHKKSSNISTDTFDACSQFIPAFSNNGLCLTRNGARLETIFRKNLHLTNFQDVFIPQEYNQTIRYISEEQSGHHLTFFVDGNKYNDLKRGIDWTKPSFSSFPLAIHPPNETGDIRGWANREINVLSGQLTKIRISLSQQKSKESVRSISIEKRAYTHGS